MWSFMALIVVVIVPHKVISFLATHLVIKVEKVELDIASSDILVYNIYVEAAKPNGKLDQGRSLSTPDRSLV